MNAVLADLLQIQQLANTAVSLYMVDKKEELPTVEVGYITAIKDNLNNLNAYLSI